MDGAININRQAYNNESLDKAFNRVPEEDKSCKDKMRSCGETVKRSFTCSGKDVANMVLAKVPFINTVRKYNIRKQLLSDAIAGLCVGIIHIPQGMGFAIMAGVPPIYGLYGSFWPAFIYLLLGTGHHVSMGTMALISLMIRTVLDREVGLLGLSPTSSTGTGNLTGIAIAPLNETRLTQLQSSPIQSPTYDAVGQILPNDTLLADGTSVMNGTVPFDLDAYKVGVVMSLSLLVGIIQFAMGVFRLGIVTTFMPTPFIGGLTTGAAFHIATSQVKFIFGISLPAREGLFKLPLHWYDIAARVPQINPAELIIAILCMTIILVINIQINQRFKDKMIAPIPPELVVVVIACLVSHFANLEDRFGVKIIKHIPSGMVPPEIPPVDRWFSHYFMDAIMISLMSFSITFSMGSLFGAKHDYQVDANQELLAVGACHSIGAFFGSFAGTAAPPRCFILDVTGATTQVSGVVTSVFLLIVIFLMGPLFAPLPNAILGSIIIVAVLPLFLQFRTLPTLWRVNKYDFSIWLFSWITVTFLDLSLGLILGIVFSILTVIIQIYRSKGVVMTTLSETELFVPSESYYKTKDMNTVEVFQFQGNLNFVSKDQFKSQLKKHLKQAKGEKNSDNPAEGSSDIATEAKESGDPNANTDEKGNQNSAADKLLSTQKSRFLVLDFSHVSYIDMMGVTTLKKIHTDLGKVGIEVMLACVSHSVMKTLEKTGGTWSNGETIVPYPALIDAVTSCQQQAKI